MTAAARAEAALPDLRLRVPTEARDPDATHQSGEPMSKPLPAAVALADQWEAEIMDEARKLAAPRLAEQDVALTDDETALLEAGYGLGYAAALVVLQRNGWLQRPGTSR